MFREFAGLLKRVSAAAGVASLVAFAGQANAASYVGSWDPAFGDDFPDLGWRGEAVFEIPDACLPQFGGANGVYVNFNVLGTNPSNCVDGGGLRIISAEVEFYNVNDSNNVLDTLYFVEPSATITMEVRDNELYGVIGSFLATATSIIDEVTQEGFEQDAPASFQLFFRDLPLGGSLINGPGTADYYAQMRWTQKRTATDCTTVQLNRFFSYYDPCSFGYSALDLQSGGSTFLTFQRVIEVPEPGSLALLLPAVGMLAAFRRRKPARAAA